jgi:adenylate kinase family enzyme
VTGVARVLVIGPSGAGKSTFARALARRTGLPVVHLDRLYWLPGWVQAAPEDSRAGLAQAAAAESWIIEGAYADALDLCLSRAQQIFAFDCQRLGCLWRVLVRVVRNRGRAQPDMPDGSPEKLKWDFMREIWQQSGRWRADIRGAIDRAAAWERTTVFRSASEAERFLARSA